MFARSHLRRLVGSRSLALLPWLLLPVFLPGCSRKPATPPQPPPAEVLVTAVKQEDVPIFHEYVGQLDASVNATIQARVQGYLVAQNYKEGTLVKKGDVLFQIDRRPFEAVLAQAKAAQLQAEASARQAELNAERNTELFQKKVASEQERDNAVQTAAAAKAQAEAQRAAVEQAQLNLDYTTVTAPVDGIAGLAKAQVGDLVGSGSTTVLTTVAKSDPIKAYFNVSEQAFAEYSKRYSDPAERAAHEKELQFELILADGSTFPQKGEMFASENQVDVRTGSLRIAALFTNPGNLLKPGQFARIRVRSFVEHGALLVPQRAVNELQGSYQVAVVGPDNKASIRPAKVGERIGQDWIITEGVKAGERVVVEGIQKVRDGATVVPKPWTPPASASPAPATSSAPSPLPSSSPSPAACSSPPR
ncbi:MAG: efflux RND transporter periplasmic adaptor subunit [Verrucomicrobia bacterium]|nr:efflux RND transporter periplasmic adaptor subunit [Verrucomicrobiota bacterium]